MLNTSLTPDPPRACLQDTATSRTACNGSLYPLYRASAFSGAAAACLPSRNGYARPAWFTYLCLRTAGATAYGSTRLPMMGSF